MEKVSIIVPIYNIDEYLEECLKSITSQTYTNIEIILIDDGSTDNSPVICDTFAQKDSRIKVVHKENGGVSSARNVGLAKATGDYIMFVDSDDLLTEDSIRYMVQSAVDSGVDCVTAIYERFDRVLPAVERDSNLSKMVSGYDATADLLYQKIVNGPFAKLYLANIVRDVKFKEGVKIAEDLYFNYEALNKCNTVLVSDKIVYLYRIRKGSAMHSGFNADMMMGLTVTDSIYRNERGTNLDKPSSYRLFMEAIAILLAIDKIKKSRSYYDFCVDALKKTRSSVLFDKSGSLKHRLAAALSFVSPKIIRYIYRFIVPIIGRGNKA